jgi:hypothetical protein
MHCSAGGLGGGNPSMIPESVGGVFWSKYQGWQTLRSQSGIFFISGEPGHHWYVQLFVGLGTVPPSWHTMGAGCAAAVVSVSPRATIGAPPDSTAQATIRLE